tara:strand:+ start:3537 stop:5588 length:2052 start_codon:yes stop_codon:yes gene_type:complete
MAEDNTNLEEIMSNWDSMDIGELGTSLLARKATMDKASAKRARKQEKREMAMGVLMAGQALFANAANKRIVERRRTGDLDMANSADELSQLKSASNIYGILDTMEASSGNSFVNKDGSLKISDVSNIYGDYQTPAWQDYLENNQQYYSQLRNSIEPQLVSHLKDKGRGDLINHPKFPALADQIVPEIIGSFLINRKDFVRRGSDLVGEGYIENKKLFEKLGGLSLSRLNQVKSNRVDRDVRKLQSDGSLLNLDNYVGALSFLAGKDQPENSVFRGIDSYLNTGIGVSLAALNIEQQVNPLIDKMTELPVFGDYKKIANSQELSDTKGLILKMLIGEGPETIYNMERNNQINSGISPYRATRFNEGVIATKAALSYAAISELQRRYPGSKQFKRPSIYKKSNIFGRGKQGEIFRKGRRFVDPVVSKIPKVKTIGAIGTALAAFSSPIFMKSHMAILQDELAANPSVANTLADTATAWYVKLKNPKEAEFNRAFFGGDKVITNDEHLMRASIAYTLASSVKDVRTFADSSEGRQQTGRPSRGGKWLGDSRNFIIDVEPMNNMLERKFTIKDGQFVAEQEFLKLDNPLDRGKAMKAEFEYILKQAQDGGLSQDEADILLENFVYNTDAASVYNEILDFSTEFTNAEIIQQLKDLSTSKGTIYDWMERYSTTDLSKGQYKRFDVPEK